MIAPGEIVLEDAWRDFALGDRRRTLKELVTGQDGCAATRVQALAGVDLRVAPGETVGIVGRNGAGKTSTLRVLAGIVPLQRGRAECGGRVATLIELGAGFGREFTGRENILLNGALHGLGKQEIEERLDDIVAFSELGHFVDVPVKTYSSGMLVRLGFSIAAHLDADVLLIDEVLAVGDEAFQRKCLRRINERILAGADARARLATRRRPSSGRARASSCSTAAASSSTGRRPKGCCTTTSCSATTASSACRPPTGPSLSRTSQLLDGDGHPRAVFSTGEPLRIVLDLGVKPGAEPTRVAFELRKSSGEPVFAAGHEVDLAGPAG